MSNGVHSTHASSVSKVPVVIALMVFALEYNRPIHRALTPSFLFFIFLGFNFV